MEKLEKRRRYCSCAPTGLSTKPMRMCYDRSWSCWESRNVIRRLRSIISSVLQSLMTWDSSPTNAPPICASFCGSSNFSENVLLHTPEGDKLAARSSSQALTRQSEAHMHFSDALTQGILEESTRQDPLHQRVLSSGNTTALASRSTYITSPLSLFVSFDSSQSLGIDELTPETLEHFTRLTDTCRYFSKGNALQIAEQILWAYLPKIERLARIPSTYQQQAASLTSQGYLIAASLVGHRNHLVERMRYSEQAVL